MNSDYVIQFAVSAVAVALMVGIAAWATRGRHVQALDEAAARRWLADEFPGRAIDGLWLASDGRGAVARSGERAFVLSRMGHGYVARQIAWAQATAAQAERGRVRIPLADVAAPKAVLALETWPPKELTA